MASRSQARAHECPACSAPAGERCRGGRGHLRVSCHAERHQLADLLAKERKLKRMVSNARRNLREVQQELAAFRAHDEVS